MRPIIPAFQPIYAALAEPVYALLRFIAGAFLVPHGMWKLFSITGDRGEIFRVTPKGEHSVFFKSDETHIRVLAFDAQGNLIAAWLDLRAKGTQLYTARSTDGGLPEVTSMRSMAERLSL